MNFRLFRVASTAMKNLRTVNNNGGVYQIHQKARLWRATKSTRFWNFGLKWFQGFFFLLKKHSLEKKWMWLLEYIFYYRDFLPLKNGPLRSRPMKSYKFKSLAIFNALKITMYSYFRSDERMFWLYFFYFSSTYACSHVFLIVMCQLGTKYLVEIL